MSATRPLLDRPDQILYGRLVRAFPGHIILAHVGLARLLAGAESSATAARASAPRCRQGVADFVVCRCDFTVLAVVELERTGVARDAVSVTQARDARRRKDALLHAVGIKVVRVAAGDLPGEAGLKTLVAALPLRGSSQQLMRRAS